MSLQETVRRYVSMQGFKRLVVLVLAALVLLSFRSIPTSLARDHQSGPTWSTSGPWVRYRLGPYWHGWSSISHMVIFGDSWTMTDYHPDGERASIENPIGNPGWPGITSTAGPNWAVYLTYNFNSSIVLTANFAVGGATIETALVRPGVPHFIPSDFLAQVNHFGDQYIGNSTYDWHPESTIFIIWMGINDIHEQDEDTVKFFPKIFEFFAERVDLLYNLGARNIMFMNVPPLQRTALAFGPEHDRLERLVHEWNKNVTELAWNFTSTYDDVSMFVFDTYGLFMDLLAKPCTLPQTCPLKVLEGFCPKYAFSWVWYDPECIYHVNEYFWINDFHPTSPVHNATAAAIAIALEAAPK